MCATFEKKQNKKTVVETIKVDDNFFYTNKFYYVQIVSTSFYHVCMIHLILLLLSVNSLNRN